MHDPFPALWADRMAALPDDAPDYRLRPTRNLLSEHLSCIVCGRGDDVTRDAPEWIVAMRSPYESITRGLHEACRARGEAKR